MNYQKKYLKYKTKYLAIKYQLGGVNKCNVCNEVAKFVCSRCKSVHYCSQEHQKNDWPKHKQFCNPVAAVSGSSGSSKVVSSTGISLPRKPIEVVLLAEEHRQVECAVRNIEIISKFILLPSQRDPETFFVVSEGRGMNICYEAIKLPERLAIIEHPKDVQTNTEMMDKLLLIAELMIVISENTHPITAPDGAPINIEFIRNRRDNDGFLKLLRETESDGLFEELLACTFETTRKPYWMNTMMRLLQQIMDTLPDNAENNNLRDLIQPLITDGSFQNLKTVFRSFRETRDTNIIQRITDRVNQNPRVDLVIIIFGQAHFDNLKRLIESNPLFRFSDKSNGSI